MKPRTTVLAVLGILSVGPSTGYGIRESIASTIGHFWSESFGQIYPTLADLEQRDLVSRLRIESRKVVYQITPAGLEHLQSVLAEDFTQAPPRDATLLRLFFGRFLGREGCRELVETTRRACQQQLVELQSIRQQLELTAVDAPDRPYWLMTLRSGELAAQARLAWAAETLAALDELTS